MLSTSPSARGSGQAISDEPSRLGFEPGTSRSASSGGTSKRRKFSRLPEGAEVVVLAADREEPFDLDDGQLRARPVSRGKREGGPGTPDALLTDPHGASPSDASEEIDAWRVASTGLALPWILHSAENRMLPFVVSRMRKRNGWSMATLCGSSMARPLTPAAVAAAATVPCSSTSINASCTTGSRSRPSDRRCPRVCFAGATDPARRCPPARGQAQARAEREFRQLEAHWRRGADVKRAGRPRPRT